MCRLSAMTAGATSDFNVAMRRLVFDRLMVLSVADDDQSYGAGVTDGFTISKSQKSYLNHGLRWLDTLSPDSIWMGHVRKPSRNTELSPYAAHPYVFEIGRRRLIAAHNGTIYGFKHTEGDPNVDSYAALRALAERLENAQLTIEVLNAWLATFGMGSQYTFMLMESDREIKIVRGNRPMYALPFMGAFIFNTSYDVLTQLRTWISCFWPNYTVGKIKPIGEHTLVTARLGESDYTVESLYSPPDVPDISDKRVLYQVGKGTKLVSL